MQPRELLVARDVRQYADEIGLPVGSRLSKQGLQMDACGIPAHLKSSSKTVDRMALQEGARNFDLPMRQVE